jgi:acyl dehydratase
MSAGGRALTYDTIEVGARFVSTGRTISESDHGLYVLLSGDWHAIHCDAAYAATSPLGRRVVHGTFGITMALGSLEAQVLQVSDTLVAALGIGAWNYKAPIFIGDTLHIEMEIAEKRITRGGDRYVLKRHIRLINQDGVVVQEGDVVSIFELPAGAGISGSADLAE